LADDNDAGFAEPGTNDPLPPHAPWGSIASTAGAIVSTAGALKGTAHNAEKDTKPSKGEKADGDEADESV
jgi:hypothetical protein